jgi:hypothetical protein
MAGTLMEPGRHGSVGMVDIVLGIAGTAAQASVLASGSSGAAGPALLASGGGSGTGVLVSHIEAGRAASASLGGAGTVGALSVPPSWTAAAPAARPVAAVSGITLAAEPIWTGMPPAMWSALPMAQLAGRRANPRDRTSQRNTWPGNYDRSSELCAR